MIKKLFIMLLLVFLAVPAYAGPSVFGDFGAKGVTINGVPILNVYSNKVFWVDSNTGSDGNKGTFGRPFATIEKAVNSLAATDYGAVVLVKANHKETITTAGGLDLDVPGLSVIGLGTGTQMPEITFTGSAADVDIDAANITLKNIEFTITTTAPTTMIDINAADFKMLDCLAVASSALAPTDLIVADANADRLVIDGFTFRGGDATNYWASMQSCINLVGGSHAALRNLWIDGEFAQAAVENVTTAAEELTVGGDNQTSYIRNNNYNVIFTAVTTTRGNVGPNINARLYDNAANITEAFVGADMQFFNPIRIVNADGESDIEWNGTASTD